MNFSAESTTFYPPQNISDHISIQPAHTLTPLLTHILSEVRREIGLNHYEESLSLEDTAKYVEAAADKIGVKLTRFELEEVLSLIKRESKPFGILQDLVDNPKISDIIITDYQKISVQIGRHNHSVDLRFSDQASYEAFVEKLLFKAKTTYSTKQPIADGVVDAFARIHAVHKSLCETGPYLTIRLNRFSSVTIADILNLGLAPREVLGYLEGLVKIGKTILIVGEVASGKTTLARALAASIPSSESILVIEDTPEIRLQHPHVRYISTREANSDDAGKISPSECIRAGMRMAMNRIIFGEIRDAEASEALVDVCSSGHPGLSTVHGRSVGDAVTRLELFLSRAQRGVERAAIREQITMAVQVLVHVDMCKITNKRRIMRVREIGPVADGAIRERDIFKYQINNKLPQWTVQNKASAHREALEQLSDPVELAKYPNQIDLDIHTLYKEMAQQIN